jgi:hypothetical protein
MAERQLVIIKDRNGTVAIADPFALLEGFFQVILAIYFNFTLDPKINSGAFLSTKGMV